MVLESLFPPVLPCVWFSPIFFVVFHLVYTIMERGQLLATTPLFNESNYAFWKRRMRALLYSINDKVWTSVEEGWVALDKPEAEWDEATKDKFNANNKALNAIFCGVSPEEFHRISHVETAKEAWDIPPTTYEGTRRAKDTKLQMLTTRFEELKMGKDESFDSFYLKLNEIVTSKLNLRERIPIEKIVRKVLRSLPEVFRLKVEAGEQRY